MSVIKAPFGFLKLRNKSLGADAAHSGLTGFGVTPERLKAIDMPASPGEFIGAVVNPIMLLAFENKAVVSRQPSVQMMLSLTGETCPLIILSSSAFEQFGKWEQITLPPLLRRPTPGIFFAAPRPLMPRTLRGFRSSFYPLPHNRQKVQPRYWPFQQLTCQAGRKCDALRCVLVGIGQSTRFERFHIGAEKLQNRSTI